MIIESKENRIITRRRAIQTLAVIGGTAITTLLAAEAVSAIDRAFKPRFVNRGNPAPLIDERPEWVRPTNWGRK